MHRSLLNGNLRFNQFVNGFGHQTPLVFWSPITLVHPCASPSARSVALFAHFVADTFAVYICFVALLSPIMFSANSFRVFKAATSIHSAVSNLSNRVTKQWSSPLTGCFSDLELCKCSHRCPLLSVVQLCWQQFTSLSISLDLLASPAVTVPRQASPLSAQALWVCSCHATSTARTPISSMAAAK